jgi:FtsP/CotA-like multicopper oxidase with cupredoxin domain
MLEVNGRSAKVFGLEGPGGRPGIRLAAGERFQVELVNESGTRTLVHWHGQLPPWTQDGFPWPQTPPILNGAVQTYDYAPIPGTYWMHSHHEMQEQSLMTAPLIVHTAAELREDRQEVVLMLHDFTFRTPEEVLAGLKGTSLVAAQLIARKIEEAPGGKGGSKVPETTMVSMAPHGPRIAMSGMTMSRPAGMQMDLNDVSYDAFLANDRTLADPEIVHVERDGRIRLRVINGGVFEPVLDRSRRTRRPRGREGRQTGIVLATPGAPILQIADRTQAAPPVDNSLEVRLAAVEPLLPRPADIVQTICLSGSMTPFAWSMNGEYWPHVTPLMLSEGQRIEIDLINHSMMAHPMHLHGHAFQLIAIDGRKINGAVRDTVLVMPMSRVRIAFDANNPGRWPFHCHNLYHVATGMMTEFRYRGIVT